LSVEKIDALRTFAGTHLLLSLEDLEGYFQMKSEGTAANDLKTLRDFAGLHLKDIDWRSPTLLFPVIVQLLDIQAFRAHLLQGLIISAGGLTESLVSLTWFVMAFHFYLSYLVEFSNAIFDSIYWKAGRCQYKWNLQEGYFGWNDSVVEK
jgi:hypothetical protein